MNPPRSRPVGWARVLVAGAVAMLSLCPAASVAAQNDPEPTPVTFLDDGDGTRPEPGLVRDDDTRDTIQRIHLQLVIVAIAMMLALVVYVWHTSPARRLRVASRRAGLTGIGEPGPDTGDERSGSG